MEQDPRAFDMAEEAVADPRPLGRALDQARNVGKHELTLLVADDPQLRAERGERIFADLGNRVGGAIEEGRLAGVGQPDQPAIGHQLKSEPDVALLARPSGAMLARGAIGRGLVAGVAAPAVAALEEVNALPFVGEIGEQAALLVIGENLGADRDLDDKVLAPGAGHVAARAALAAGRAEMLGVAEIDQRVEPGHRFEHDIAALAALAAVRSAIFHELFAPEADRPGAARAAADEDLGLIEKMHGGAFSEQCGERAAGWSSRSRECSRMFAVAKGFWVQAGATKLTGGGPKRGVINFRISFGGTRTFAKFALGSGPVKSLALAAIS